MSGACGTVVATVGTVVATVSWPGLAGPSTTLPPSAPPVVDGRHKAGHDTMGTPARYFNAHGARPVIDEPVPAAQRVRTRTTAGWPYGSRRGTVCRSGARFRPRFSTATRTPAT